MTSNTNNKIKTLENLGYLKIDNKKENTYFYRIYMSLHYLRSLFLSCLAA